ncbi:UvrD-helicase domain-containing protein [Desulfosporosinus shakirovi]|uniref:UvrD-helicase domain-containing protein n=1 Tax=Desulfosporosinus shakirovi TaxID=2885154 RepID=UPI001E4766F7|nr:ATP-dependent helicase [Desulfosporosinus sp. SRJS8]MCB8817380.1 ATP-dependent helicase [Desulfosporosinus sp. SRJS8]
MIQINSDTLIAIENHFRVSAGPGAGKTYWLVEHIKNVLHHSTRLEKTRKVACITYTNIAVETILNRLGTSTEQVEVSTIHSFLYKNIVKPYAAFLVDDYGLKVAEIDGHDDIILSNYSFLREWKAKTRQQRITDDKLLVKAFRAIRWKFDDSGDLVVKPDYPQRVGGYNIKNDSYFEYKKMAWGKAVIHHDDVLFFSYQLIKKHPFIIQVLQSKFPYFFVDEFQDTNPIQVAILKLIGERETIVGIIGDEAQSIYGFQGAEPQQFGSFMLHNIEEYEMADNRRSTNQIIDVLNLVRVDLVQNKYRNVNGEIPVIIVGEMITALKKATEMSNNEPIYSLSRINITSNAMKKEVGGTSFNDKLIEELSDKDKSSNNNGYRSKVVIACLKATEYARERNFKNAIKELERIFKDKDDEDKGKKEALRHICLLLKKYEEFKDKPLFDFYSIVKNEIKSDISRLASGAAKTFYEGHSYQQLALCVKIVEDVSRHKTIHKAKGDEFENVLLILTEESDLSFLLNPDLKGIPEEHRINYVAVSRAIKRLFINIPSLPKGNLSILGSIFNIVRV